jgi:hypothetical protein
VSRAVVAGRVLAGLELVLFVFAGHGRVAFVFILGVKQTGGGLEQASTARLILAMVYVYAPYPFVCDRSSPMAGMLNTVVSAGDIWPRVSSRYKVSGRVIEVGSWGSSRSARRVKT